MASGSSVLSLKTDSSETIAPLLPAKRNFFSKYEQKHKTLDSNWKPLDASSIGQPKNITGTMKDYQIEGLRWMVSMYENGANAILGDEMGLGKSLQTIAFLCHLKHEYKVNGPHLIVVPLSVLESWMNECARWCPTLKVARFHGPENIRMDIKHTLEAEHFDVVVTTYEMFTAESKYFKHRAWSYLILDEGHKIKNDQTNISHEVQTLHSQNRLILTGTPLQNNLLELWSLFHFLYGDVFDSNSRELFKDAFNISQNSYDLDLVEASARFLELIMLRRMKKTVDLDIPDKEEVTIYVPISPAQRAIYKRLLTDLDEPMIQNIIDGDKSAHQLVETTSKQTLFQKLKAVFFNLQMVCSHPFLLIKDPVPGLTDDPLQAISCSSKLILLDKLLPELKAKGHRVLIFAQYLQVLDLLEDYLDSKGWGCARLDGSIGRARRQLDMQLFNDKKSDMFVFLLSTRAGGMGITLTAADTVIFYDSDWNPQVDLQAMARAHRIGQKKKVTVYRLCIQDTIEERLLQHAQRKLWLSAKVTEESSQRNANNKENQGMSTAQLLNTIKFGANMIFKASDTFQDFLNDDVNVLLDRSKEHARLIKDAEMKLNDFDADAAEEGTFSVRLFEGTQHERAKEKDWASKWAEEVQGKKRRRVERTVNVGGHSVLAQTMHSDEAVPSIVTMLKVAGEENKFKDVFDIRRFERQENKHDYQTECHACGEGGDFVFCRSCPRVYHPLCIGMRKRDVGAKINCMKHRCMECDNTASQVGGLILRCATCVNSYCYDHLPTKNVKYLGETIPELLELGYMPSKQFYYIKCADCVKARK